MLVVLAKLLQNFASLTDSMHTHPLAKLSVTCTDWHLPTQPPALALSGRKLLETWDAPFKAVQQALSESVGRNCRKNNEFRA